MEDLEEFALRFINKYPEHKDEVMGLLELCRDEIDAGGSVFGEIENCKSAIDDLIAEEED